MRPVSAAAGTGACGAMRVRAGAMGIRGCCLPAAPSSGPLLQANTTSVRRRRLVCASAQDGAGVGVTFQTKDGSGVTATASAGAELRKLMLDNKVDVYTTWGKVWQCGGYGQCGTCMVEVVEGQELLSARSAAENKHLKGKPDTWRLACQTDITAAQGKVAIKTKPQA